MNLRPYGWILVKEEEGTKKMKIFVKKNKTRRRWKKDIELKSSSYLQMKPFVFSARDKLV